MTSKEFERLLEEKLFGEFAVELKDATYQQIYHAMALIVRGMLSHRR